MKLEWISDRVYANTEGKTGGNVGVILLEKGVAAVDAQYPVSGADFRRSIRTITGKPVTHLLLTHYHGDHVFGSQAFEDCEIISHSYLKKKMLENLGTVWAPGNLERLIEDVRRNRPENFPLYQGLRIVLPGVTFDTRLTLEDVEMVNMGGHTECSSVVYVPEDRMLFAGDLLFAKKFPWAGDASADPERWIQAFRMILEMDVDAIIPGHGPVSDKEEVRRQLRWFEEARKEIKKLISEGASEDDSVNHVGYPDFYPPDRPEWRENSLRHWYRFYSKYEH